MLIDISAAWKTFDAGTSADLYSRELTALANEYGRDRVQAGILKAIRTEKEYCPTPAKLREHIQNAESGGKMIGVTDPRCEACSGTGWKFKQGENPQRYVERCHCWHKELTA